MTQHHWLLIALLVSVAWNGGCGTGEVVVPVGGIGPEGAPTAAPTSARSSTGAASSTPSAAPSGGTITGSAEAAPSSSGEAATQGDVDKLIDAETEAVAEIDWRQIEAAFGLESTVSNLDRQARWKSLEGKRVEWQGQVGDISVQFGLPAVEIKMNRGSSLAEILLHVKKDFEANAQSLRKGDTVTFIGRLTSWGTVVPIVTLHEVLILSPQQLTRRSGRQQAAKTAAENAARAQAEDAALAATRQREAIEAKQAEDEARQAKRESTARAKLHQARKFYDSDKKETAKKWFQEIVNEYPDTEAATTAKKFLRMK